ncbi:MAG: hypothetical protein R3D80_17255 [Paracoccaceae bacterium]
MLEIGDLARRGSARAARTLPRTGRRIRMAADSVAKGKTGRPLQPYPARLARRHDIEPEPMKGQMSWKA